MSDEAVKQAACQCDSKGCDAEPDAADRRILVVVDGGVAQDVLVTPGLNAKVYRIDWDNIREGDVDSEPWVEHEAIEVPLSEIEEALAAAKQEFTRRRVCRHCGRPLADHVEEDCNEKLWKDNDLQFPRALAALGEFGLSATHRIRLAERLGVSGKQFDELLQRATDVAAHNKAKFGLYDDTSSG